MVRLTLSALLHSSYCHLDFSAQKWYKISEDHQKKRIEKFFHTSLSPNLASTGGTEERSSESPLDATAHGHNSVEPGPEVIH